MKPLFLFLLLQAGWSCLPAQTTDEKGLIREAETLLSQSSATVSTILTDPRFLPVHPADAFRNLIRQHSQAAPLAITTAEEPGRKIRVSCMVTGKDGKPLADALVYLYQTDAKGWYSASSPHVGGSEGDMRQARLFGYVKTDSSGRFELHTVKPAGYPQSDLPAHIHVHIRASGHAPFVNEFLFDDDERLQGSIREQAIRNGFFISKPEPAAAPFEQSFTYRVALLR